jgi:hypothetical protein
MGNATSPTIQMGDQFAERDAMAPRKKAGPNICFLIQVQLRDEEWRQFAAAIDPNISIADSARLSDGRSLRQALRESIERTVSCEAGPTTREARLQLRRFWDDISDGFFRMHPSVQQEFLDKSPHFIVDLADALNKAKAEFDEEDRDQRDPRLLDTPELFLADIVALIACCHNIRASFPSKGPAVADGHWRTMEVLQ